jgi:hypothetical protein
MPAFAIYPPWSLGCDAPLAEEIARPQLAAWTSACAVARALRGPVAGYLRPARARAGNHPARVLLGGLLGLLCGWLLCALLAGLESFSGAQRAPAAASSIGFARAPGAGAWRGPGGGVYARSSASGDAHALRPTRAGRSLRAASSTAAAPIAQGDPQALKQRRTTQQSDIGAAAKLSSVPPAATTPPAASAPPASTASPAAPAPPSASAPPAAAPPAAPVPSAALALRDPAGRERSHAEASPRAGAHNAGAEFGFEG